MRKSFWVVGLAAPLAAGCVSTGTYKILQDDRAALLTKSASLEEEVTKLKLDNAQLIQEKETMAKQSQQIQGDFASVLNQLRNEVKEGQLTIHQEKNSLSLDVAERIFFDSGQVKLKQSGQDVLRNVGAVLAQYPDKIIQVVGHSDNVPMNKSSSNPISSNWDLSVIRATSVVKFLQEESRIPGERLTAVGRGEYDPIAPNDTPEGRQKNRRIEIRLIDKKIMDMLEGGPMESK